MSAPDHAALPGLPRDAEGPVFREPWEAQAFALAVRLNAQSVFTWAEWAETLARELATDPGDDGSRYYEHWVAALETLSAKRALVDRPELAARKHDWEHAYRGTPHGKPVELAAARRGPSGA